jgi:choline dehydrogenase-like flavoprotein
VSEEIRTEYCVAGGGIAGAVLAEKLAAAGREVVLLEQGPRFTVENRLNMLFQGKETLNDFADYNDRAKAGVVTPHTSARQDGQVAQWAAQGLFGLGGTALHYEGFMIRPREDDFKVRTLYGYGRDWPISYAELEPWFLRAERETGVSGNDDNPYASPRSGPFPMPAHEFSYFDREIFGPAMKKLGITTHSCPRAINSRSYRRRARCMACRICKFCPSGARYSPDRVHVPALEKRANAKILENVSLRRLETAPGGNHMAAAHAIRISDRKPLVIQASQYVLAMGGVETPRMLMLSVGGGPHGEGLGNMGGQLGRRFSDHLHPYLTYDVGRPVGGRLGFETISSEHFRAQSNRREQPAFMLFAAPAMDWFPIGNEATSWATRNNVLSLETLRASIQRIATLSGMTELEGQGTIELDYDKLDAFGSPVAKVTMKLTDWDRRSLEKMAGLAPVIAEAMGAANVSEISSEFGLGYHPSGATAMAETPDEGVCDSNLKVFGLDNLYLVSNSVFPHMPANPPTLTIAALALRLAAHLEGRVVL